MLYPGLDLSKVFHEDHVFPRSRFTRKRLAEAGVPVQDIEACMAAVDRLPNLQLLQGQANVEKQAVLPAKWLETAFVSEEQRTAYVEQNDLDVLQEDMTDFMKFYEARKEIGRAS